MDVKLTEKDHGKSRYKNYFSLAKEFLSDVISESRNKITDKRDAPTTPSIEKEQGVRQDKIKLVWVDRNRFEKVDFIILLFLLAISTYLLLSNLGQRSFWYEDEVGTVFISKAVSEYNKPICVTDDKIVEGYKKWCKNGVYLEYLWLHNYLAAISISLLGFSVFSARLPFAIIGIFYVLLNYYSLKKYSDRKTAFLSSTLILTTVWLLLIFRVSRYMGVSFLLNLFFIDSFFELLRNKRKWYFFFISVLSIFNHFGAFLVQFGGLFFCFLLTVRKSNITRKISEGLFMMLPLIVLIISLWVFGVADNVKAASHVSTLVYLKSLYFYYQIILEFFFPILLAFIFFFKDFRERIDSFFIFNMAFIFSTFLISGFRPGNYHTYVLSAAFSLFFILSKILIYIYEQNKKIGVIIIVLVLFTNVLNILPICVFYKESASIDERAYRPKCSVRSAFFEYIFYELREDYKDPVELTIDYFKTNVPQGGTMWYLAGEMWGAYYFSPMNIFVIQEPDYIVDFNKEIQNITSYTLVKEFDYDSLLPEKFNEKQNEMEGYGFYYPWESVAKGYLPWAHGFKKQSTKKFRIYKRVSGTTGDRNVTFDSLLNTGMQQVWQLILETSLIQQQLLTTHGSMHTGGIREI